MLDSILDVFHKSKIKHPSSLKPEVFYRDGFELDSFEIKNSGKDVFSLYQAQEVSHQVNVKL